MPDTQMTFGSLFAGIGGIDLGLEWAGMRCAWQVEIDDYCLGRLEKKWPAVSKWNNIKTPNADIVGGLANLTYNSSKALKELSMPKKLDPKYDVKMPPGQTQGFRIDVGVDCWSFYPISIDEIKAIID